jgi:hypothetical protein
LYAGYGNSDHVGDDDYSRRFGGFRITRLSLRRGPRIEKEIAWQGPLFRSPLIPAISTRFAMTARFFGWSITFRLAIDPLAANGPLAGAATKMIEKEHEKNQSSLPSPVSPVVSQYHRAAKRSELNRQQRRCQPGGNRRPIAVRKVLQHERRRAFPATGR